MYTSKSYDADKKGQKERKKSIWKNILFDCCGQFQCSLFVLSFTKKTSDGIQGLFSTIQNVFMMLREDSPPWPVTMVTSKSKDYVWLGCPSQGELTGKKSFEKFKMEGRKILAPILYKCSPSWLSYQSDSDYFLELFFQDHRVLPMTSSPCWKCTSAQFFVVIVSTVHNLNSRYLCDCL